MSNPGIDQAKALARRYGKDVVIVLYLGDGVLGYASYGRDGRLCKVGKELGDVAFEAIERELRATLGSEDTFRDGKVRKNGVNPRPTTSPPPPPKGRGFSRK